MTLRGSVGLILAAAAIGMWSPPGRAQDRVLTRAIDAVLHNDPVLRTAAAQQRVDAEALPKARADLLPRLSFQASQSKNTTTSHLAAPGGGTTPDVTQPYDSKTMSLNLSQPLIRPRAWMGYLQARSTVSAADYTYDSAIQQAIDRAVTACTEKLRLEFDLEAAKASESSLELRLASVRHLAKIEKATRVDVQTAEADYAQAHARVLDATAALEAADGELRRVTGRDWGSFQGRIGDIRPVAGRVATVAENKLLGLTEFDIEQHPEVALRRLRLDAAQLEVSKRRSDHAPTLDLVAGLIEGDSASDVTIGRFSRTRTIGLQLNIPIYAGGSVSSSVREGTALMEKAEIDLANSRLTVANDRRQALSQLRAGILSLKAGIDAIAAADLLLRQIRLGISAGLHSEVELKDALARKATSVSTTAASIAKVVSTYSKLQLAEGALKVADMAELSAALDSN